MVSGSDDLQTEPSVMPTLVMGMAFLAQAGLEVGQNAIRALSSMVSEVTPRTIWPGTGPTPTPSPSISSFRPGPWATTWCSTTGSTSSAFRTAYAGMIQVDGNWYCPGMPESLINATLDFRNGLIDEATYQARIEERRAYRRSARRPVLIPTATSGCGARRPNLHPSSAASSSPAQRALDQGQGPHPGHRLAPPAHSAESAPRSPSPCLLRPGPSLPRLLPHETPEWHAMYATLRNSVEGMNGFIKDGAREAVDDPERRRIRGVAAQSVLVAFQLFAANLRKIDEFLANREAEGKSVRKLPSRRRTQSLPSWAPQTPTTVVAGDATDDPDPPLTA